MASQKRFFLPEIIVPNRWLRIEDTHVEANHPLWYFYWSPDKPNKLCESGELFKYNRKSSVYIPPILIYWIYIPYEAEAYRLGFSPGLNFSKGKLSYLPNYMRMIVFDFIVKRYKHNILTMDEYLALVKNREIKPYPRTIKQIIKRGDHNEVKYIKDKKHFREGRLKDRSYCEKRKIKKGDKEDA